MTIFGLKGPELNRDTSMWGMPTSTPLQSLILRAWSDGKVVASVCHGSASLTGVRNPDGTPFVKSKTISAFTDSEEDPSSQ
ncbi:type 1 glutamine amidotransferase family protein [Acetobacter persici]|uniref:hypothetical protein n=1 Tax=Acetobacter persici TaxID=1076596 RepID=UPI001BAD5A08|nr:hypothetical protein [Acetobacter persici]MBS0964308.1 hypothetical protein [Acetobacter persici]